MQKFKLIMIINPRLVLIMFLIFNSCWINKIFSQTKKIDFENYKESTLIQQQYEDIGVIFPSGGFINVGNSQILAHTGSNYLNPQTSEIFDYQGPFVIRFTSPQSRAKLFAGALVQIQNTQLTGVLTAYNVMGKKIVSDGPKTVSNKAITTSFEVMDPTSSISYLELNIKSTGEVFELIDDLEFEGQPAPDPQTINPVIKINSPTNGEIITNNSILVEGTITGNDLKPISQLVLSSAGPVGKGTLPPFSTSINLNGSGNNRTFSINIPSGLGVESLTISATNNIGIIGSGTVKFINLPASINNFSGLSSFGNLQWAIIDNGCQIAVYENGAVCDIGGGLIKTIKDNIFKKWNEWVMAKWTNTIHGVCPTSDAHIVLQTVWEQSFQNGRIYDESSKGIYFVPKVFADVIDIYGGENGIGVPVNDPTRCVTTKTWLFQQFTRPGAIDWAPTTIEIKGEKPVLWVERQGSNVDGLQPSNQFISETSATISDSFPCTATEGPCNVLPPPHLNSSDVTGMGGCNSSLTIPEWVSIVGDNVMTLALGVIINAHFAIDDDEASHDHNNDRNGHIWSDYNIVLYPIDPYRGILKKDQSTGDYPIPTLEVEFEYYYSQWCFIIGNQDMPRPGDLAFISGRWIRDCGHPPYDAEIHPPFVVAYTRTETDPSLLATKKSVCRIWINSYYTGESFDFFIYPPPRPSPNSFMVLEIPKDTDAASKITSSFTSDVNFSSYIKAHFSGIPHSNSHDQYGKLSWPITGVEYCGRWRIGWEQENQFKIITIGNTWWP
jgi:hypothetical protein